MAAAIRYMRYQRQAWFSTSGLALCRENGGEAAEEAGNGEGVVGEPGAATSAASGVRMAMEYTGRRWTGCAWPQPL
jgi:hypothetical protein